MEETNAAWDGVGWKKQVPLVRVGSFYGLTLSHMIQDIGFG
jgi:hypothetical protein